MTEGTATVLARLVSVECDCGFHDAIALQGEAHEEVIARHHLEAHHNHACPKCEGNNLFFWIHDHRDVSEL